LFGEEYGGIKRMYVRPHTRGRGFAKMMLNHLADYVRSHGVGILRLEKSFRASPWALLGWPFGFWPGGWITKANHCFRDVTGFSPALRRH
jgi:GNAT superfamily N-acetyltransferase